MSKRNDQTVEIPEEDIKVEEVRRDELVEETPVEEVVEKDTIGKKIIRGLKKAAPVLVIGGVIATAFALGRSSGTDAACLALLEAENEEKTDENVPESETDDSDGPAEERVTEDNIPLS